MFENYLSLFLSLNTNKYAGIIAPHKPVLLITVIELYDTGYLSSKKIELSEQLEKSFKVNWHKYVGNIPFYRPNIDKPYWHLQNEPFWRLVSKNNQPLSSFRSPYSVKRLRDNVYAEVDDELFELLKNENNRKVYKKAIIDQYLDNYKEVKGKLVLLTAMITLFTNVAY